MLSGGISWVSTIYRIWWWKNKTKHKPTFFVQTTMSDWLKAPHHVVTAASRIQGRTEKQFCDCAPQRPHIYSFTEGKPQQDFWCPARGQTTGLPLLSKLRCSSSWCNAKTCLDFLTCRSEFGHTNPQPLLIFHRPDQSQSAWLWRALGGGSPAWCFQASGLRVRPGWPSSDQVQWPT